MNTFKCIDCHTTQAHECKCGSGRLWLIGDLHLRSMGIDGYIGLEGIQGKAYLLIKKPSGQVQIPLQDQDLITTVEA